MTKRHSGFLVTLEEDIREDDAEHIINAIKMIGGVIKVEPVGSDTNIQLAKNRAKREMQDKIWEVLSED